VSHAKFGFDLINTTRVIQEISLQNGAIPSILKTKKSEIYILWGFSLWVLAQSFYYHVTVMSFVYIKYGDIAIEIVA